MRPTIQRITKASILLRPARTLRNYNPTHVKPVINYVPFHIQQSIETSRSVHTTPHLPYLIQPMVFHDDEPSVEEPATPEETADNKFQFVAFAAWHPKHNSKTTDHQIDAGEDAFFQTTTPDGLAMGVADGVGGWSRIGVDPALFSWTLMENACSVAKTNTSLDARQILDTAFCELRKGGKVSAGSSTACILNLSKVTGEMTTCNLGDSAFLLVRDKKIVYESPSQQHYFNCPYQLTIIPESYPNRDEVITDLPKDADTKSFFLKEGDLILLATDGYFDNMYPEDTLELINTGLEPIWDQQNRDEFTITNTIKALATSLTERARDLSLNPKRLSPWAKAAQAHGSKYSGGKLDDITCIVTYVQLK